MEDDVGLPGCEMTGALEEEEFGETIKMLMASPERRLVPTE
jgi:hypothetical protein